jgi:hypothetical protein
MNANRQQALEDQQLASRSASSHRHVEHDRRLATFPRGWRKAVSLKPITDSGRAQNHKERSFGFFLHSPAKVPKAYPYSGSLHSGRHWMITTVKLNWAKIKRAIPQIRADRS